MSEHRPKRSTDAAPSAPAWLIAPRRLACLVRGDLGLLAVAFAITRLALYALGLRFSLVMDWMFLADPLDLKQRLLETVFYFHAFPPGMNLLTGWLLAISEAHLAALAQVIFAASGLLMCGSLLLLLRAVGAGRRAALGVAVAFSLIPQTLYFENLYLYDYPVPALLSFSAVLFHRAFSAPSLARWLYFFLVCALLGWIRSALHLVWFLALVGFALFGVRRGQRRTVLAAAAGPLVLLLALYIKNYVVFGVFDSQSQSGGNFTLITTHHMPRSLRKQWVAEGKISPFADMSFAAPPSAFLPYFPGTENPDYPQTQSLQNIERPTLKAPNYNHWFFLSVNDERRVDARYCLTQRPWEYVHTVLARSLPQAFSASTFWHPRSRTPSSPHAQHRSVLGWWEDAYERIVHRFPVRPYGLYVLLPVCLGWVLFRGYRQLRAGSDPERARGALILLCAMQIVYLIAITALLTYGENARYRYIVEPFIWLVAASTLIDLSAHLRARRARGGASLPA
jgi:hypothetical protein